LAGRHQIELARRSITVAAAFGLASAFSVVLLGDESGYSATLSQRMKLPTIEAMWEPHPAPAPVNLIGFPDQETRETHSAIEIPRAMGLIGPRSLTTETPGINNLVAQAQDRIRSGIIAHDALMHIREARDAADPAITARFEEHSADLGFPSCCAATPMIPVRPLKRRSSRPRTTRFRRSGRCSGPSG
jgi:cytochrome d ubiquinol oxidase subunit I